MGRNFLRISSEEGATETGGFQSLLELEILGNPWYRNSHYREKYKRMEPPFPPHSPLLLVAVPVRN